MRINRALQTKKAFYLFLGLHSLLFGVFPFYLPVYLWQGGFDLVQISLLIAVTGVGFQAGLWGWDRLRNVLTLQQLFLCTTLCFFLLLGTVFLVGQSIGSAVCLTFAYGFYNSFFWTTQRALFVEVTDPNRAGQAYGNFQLFVFAALQIGILAGGWLLQADSFIWLVVFCACVAVSGNTLLLSAGGEYPDSMTSTPSLDWNTVTRFKDEHHSRTMFLVDGGFLFLESYFWVISLFLLAHESFTRLGVVVIVLALIFGGLFFLLKNTIDRLGKRRMFILAVGLYALSWVLRAVVADDLPLLYLFVLLVLITFATSFFRLALNKRFYDLARESGAHRYLILKSYYSQTSLIVCFIVFAGIASLISDPAVFLDSIYIAAALVAPVFAVYGARRYRHD